MAICVAEADIQYYVLECLKAIYGLVDAPLLWQMAKTSRNPIFRGEGKENRIKVRAEAF